MTLHVFTYSEMEYVIAETTEEARGYYAYPEIFEDDGIDIEQCPDDLKFKVWYGENNVAAHNEGDLIEKTMGEWAEQEGAGYFCTTEY